MNIAEFTEKLNTVAWETLYHSYGGAEDVPDMVLRLLSASPSTRDNARSNLEHSLNHQGVQRWDSTARVTPFLLELLADPETPERHRLIPILTDFAVGSADGVYLQTSFHIDEAYTAEGSKEYGYYVFREDKGSPNDIAYGQTMREIYNEVRKGIPLYLQLISDKHFTMRVFAPYVLGWLTDATDETIPPLLAQYQREKHVRARTSQILALSYGTSYNPTQRAACVPLWQQALTKATDTWERRALAIALLRAEVLTDEVRETLISQLRQPDPKMGAYTKKFPWWYSGSSAMLANLVFKHAPAWKHEVVIALCDGLKHCTNEHETLDQAQSLLYQNFERPADPPKWYDAYRTITLEDLNDTQRYILNTFVNVPLVWHFGNMQLALNDYGLPAYQDRLQKFMAGEGDVMQYHYQGEHLMPPDFFTRLNAVTWRTLKHRYGMATDMPDMLRAILAPDKETRTAAFEKAASSLFEGYPGQARLSINQIVVPFLLEMLSRAPQPTEILALLADIAVDGARAPRRDGYQTEYHYFLHGFDLDVNYTAERSLERGHPVFFYGQGSAEDLAYGQEARKNYDIVCQALPIFLPLLSHPQPAMRVFAAFLVGWLTTESAKIVPPLVEQFRREDFPAARASQALALAYLSLKNTKLREMWRSDIEAAFTKADHSFEQRMLGITLLWTQNPPQAICKALCDDLRRLQPSVLTMEAFPWARLDDNNVLLDLMLHHAPADWKADMLDAACHYIAKVTDKDMGEDAAETLMRGFFAELDPDERMNMANTGEGKVTTLTAEQRKILQTLVNTDAYWDEDGYPHLALLGYGVPGYRHEIQALLKGK